MDRPWTKGPWEVEPAEEDDFEDGVYVVMGTRLGKPCSYRSAHEWYCSAGIDEAESLANAHLIAAAPAMYEALEAAATALWETYGDDGRVFKKITSALRAANRDAFREGE